MASISDAYIAFLALSLFLSIFFFIAPLRKADQKKIKETQEPIHNAATPNEFRFPFNKSASVIVLVILGVASVLPWFLKGTISVVEVSFGLAGCLFLFMSVFDSVLRSDRNESE